MRILALAVSACLLMGASFAKAACDIDTLKNQTAFNDAILADVRPDFSTTC
jgi:hypothetical protein